MSDRIEAAEAILATLDTARGRIAALASAHLPFDRALALELRARVGASAERAQLELVSELVDRRLAIWRGARGLVAHVAPAPATPRVAPVAPVAPIVAPVHAPPVVLTESLPVSTAPLDSGLDAEDVGDEATPMSGDALPVEPLVLPAEPEHEVTAAQVEETLPSVGEPPELGAQDIPSAESVEVMAEDLGEDLEVDDDIEAVVLEEEEAAEAMVEEEPSLAEPIAEQPPVRELAQPPVAPTPVEEEPPPTSFDHLVRFVDPASRRTELLFDESMEEPVAEEATQQDGSGADDELLAEAVEAALGDEAGLEATGEVLELERPARDEDVEDAASADAPATMGEPDPDELGEDAGAEELEGEVEDEEPPVLVAQRVPTVVAVGGNDMDDERTLLGVPVLTNVDEDEDDQAEPAPPPRRDAGRAAPVAVQARGRETGSTLEADAGDEPAEDEVSLGSRGGFTVTLERPEQTDEEDEDAVYDLGAGARSDAPRLTDEDEGYSVSATTESPSEPVAVDLHLAKEFLQRARDAEARGDLSRAIVHYQDLLDLTPESLEAWLGRGRCFMEMGDYAAAMSDFQRAEDLDQKSPEPLVEMGNLFFARKEYRRAIEFYDHAIEIDPTHAMARCRRGICHHYRKNHKQAFQDLQRAYSLNPDIPNIRKYVQMAVKAMEKSR